MLVYLCMYVSDHIWVNMASLNMSLAINIHRVGYVLDSQRATHETLSLRVNT